MAAKRILFIPIANEPPVGYKPDDLPTDYHLVVVH
jgi:hypothetical protein